RDLELVEHRPTQAHSVANAQQDSSPGPIAFKIRAPRQLVERGESCFPQESPHASGHEQLDFGIGLVLAKELRAPPANVAIGEWNRQKLRSNQKGVALEGTQPIGRG